jgi:poly(A) polymerase
MQKVSDKRYKEALQVIQILNQAGFKAMLAGGCVRDRQLGIEPKDYDVATEAEPDRVCAIFKQKGIKLIPTGIEHGTVTVIVGLDPIEITSLREDVATDGRHAIVKFGRSFKEDARRRDFTINAMFEDENAQVYDYFDGLGDLKRGILRFVGDPEQRIKEDYLRIMRLFRFWARFGFAPDADTLQAVKEQAQGLERVSGERLTSELLQMLSCHPVAEVLESFVATGVNRYVTPEASDHAPSIEHFTKLDQTSLLRRDIAGLSCLLAQGAQAKKPSVLHARLKLSRKDAALLSLSLLPSQKQIVEPNAFEAMGVGQLMEYLDSFEEKLVSLDKSGFPLESTNLFIDYLYPLWTLLYPQSRKLWEKLFQIESKLSSKRRQPLPISGKDLCMALQISPGPDLGLLLRYLKRSFRDGVWSTKQQALELLRQESILSVASNYLES